MRNAHARIISVSLRYRRLVFAPKYKLGYWKTWFIYLIHVYLDNNLYFKRKFAVNSNITKKLFAMEHYFLN